MPDRNEIVYLRGFDAIEYAESHHITGTPWELFKYADPTESARDNVPADVARRIASEDPSLIYVRDYRWRLNSWLRATGRATV